MTDIADRQLAVVLLDYEQSLKFIDGVVRISVTFRQVAIAAGLALSGVAVQNERPPLAVAAAILALVLGLLDAYHGWLYSQALKRVAAMEEIFRQQKRAAGAPEDDAVQTRYANLVDDFRVGAISNFERFRVRSLAAARPAGMYVIYPLLCAAAVIVALTCG